VRQGGKEKLKRIRQGKRLYTRKAIDTIYGESITPMAAESNRAVFTRSQGSTASDNLRNCMSLTLMADAPRVKDGKPVRRARRETAAITMHLHPTEVASAEGYKGPVYEQYKAHQPRIMEYSRDFYTLPKDEQAKQVDEWKEKLSSSSSAPLLPLKAEDTIRAAAGLLRSELGEGTKIKTVLVPGQHTLNKSKGTYPESSFAFERTQEALRKLKQEGVINNVSVKGLHGSARGAIATFQQGRRVYRIEPISKGGKIPKRHEKKLRQELESGGVQPSKAYKWRRGESTQPWPWTHSPE